MVCSEADCAATSEFSPTVGITLDNLTEGGTSSLTYTMSQDDGESEIFSSSVVSDGGSFNLSGLALDDVIGSGTLSLSLYAGDFDIESDLVVTNIDNDIYHVFNHVTASNSPVYPIGSIAGGFVISNTATGISISTVVPEDGDFIAEAYSMSLTFDDLFVNPSAGDLTFTSTLTAELGDVDVQDFVFTIEPLDFSPTVNMTLDNLTEGGTSSLTYTMSQDDGESEIFSSSVVSDGGSFNLSGLALDDVIGSGTLSLSLYAGDFDIESDLVVTNIDNDIYHVFNHVTASNSPVYPIGSIAGGFVISNTATGISISTLVPEDGDFIAEAYSMSLTFDDLFVNPSAGDLTFTSTLTAELGDVDVQDFVFTIEPLDFSPTVNMTLDNLTEGGTSSLTYTMSQDDGESEIFSSSVVSDGGSFNLSGLALDDVIGSGTLSLSLYAGDFDIESDLVVTNIDNDIYHVFNHVTASNSPVYPIGSIAGGFVISNTATGISISTLVPEDGDFIAEAYSMSLTFDDLFVNPSAGDLTFTSTLTAELGDVDVQDFVFTIEPLDFSPTVNMTLDNLTEGGTSSLTYTMSQDDGESEIFSSSVVSDGGSFNLSGLALDDVIGSGTLSLSLYAGDFDIESDLVVTNIDNDIYHVFNHVTASNSPVYPIGSIAGGFVISNTATGISISTLVPEDGDFIAEAYSMSLTFDDLFVNPSAGDLTFTSTLTAELGDVDVQGFIFDIIFIDGCTDPVACNYDPVAVNDDGSCDYCSCEIVSSDSYTLTIEATAAVNSEAGTIYRFYVDMADPTDRMSAVFGTNESHLIINTPDGAFNSSLNSSWSASGINPAFLAVFPDMADDTYATIGLDGPAASSGIAGTTDPSLVEDPAEPISTYFLTDGATSLSSTTLVGSSWYVLSSAENGLPDDDMRVLVLQVTTTGEINGTLNYQVFPLGDGTAQVQYTTEFDGVGVHSSSSNEYGCGCTDASACNYIVEAIYEDGSCTYINESDCDCDGNVEDAIGVCGGTCTADIDEDGDCDDVDDCVGAYDNCGVCNGDDSSCTGCLITFACNYDSTVLINDVTLCEYDSCAGCMDIAACNYEDSATWDDGSCVNPDECGVCNGEETGPGAVYECGCADIAEGECDCDGNVLDECGVCGGVGIAEGECDCEGNVLDACGVCGGAGIVEGECDCEGSVLDECGVCGGAGIADGDCDCDGNVLDECGVCGGAGISEGECDCEGNVLDACGVCGGAGIAEGECDCEGSVLDECGVCGGAGIADGDCDCDGNVLDECGVCGGGGIAEGECDCAGNVLDECGVCGGAGIAEGECDCEGSVLDECGVCGGAGIADGDCDCDGNVLDECGVCGGGGIAEGECDCAGNVLDECGVCGGAGIADGDCDCDGNVLDECGVCGGGGIAEGECDCAGNVIDECGECGGAGISEGECDCEGNVLDACGVCGGAGIAEGECDCEGSVLDECGVCGGAGIADGDCDCDGNVVDECGVCGGAGFAEGECDCEGSVLDECGVCGGDGVDEDCDGICDSIDLCIATCEDPFAPCVFFGCTDPDNPGYDPIATDDDGSCLAGGCTISVACNYNPDAEYLIPGVCEFSSCVGCTDATACNFDADASLSNNFSCNYAEMYYDCDGNCLEDVIPAGGNGVCDPLDVYGCIDSDNPGYNPSATINDGSCLVGGCLIPFACNFDLEADYIVVSLCEFTSCLGCTDEEACNYNPEVTISSAAQCTFPTNPLSDCDGNCINDSDGDDICDEQEIAGCTNDLAINYNEFATDDDGSCSILVGGCVIPFACNFDPAADFYVPGSCDFNFPCGGGTAGMSEAGCTNSNACNYGAEGVPCQFFDAAGNICMIGGCNHPSACNYNDDAQYNDGSCDFSSCATYGCTLSGACNFNDSATYNDGSCDYTSCYGCTNTLSENFDSNATHNDGSCIIHGCTVSVACNYDVTATSENGSCEYSSCMNLGCTDLSACNYDSNAIVSDGSCVTATYGFDCNGNCITDLNNNNICDADDIYGCTDATALNFNNGATMNNGTCLYDTFGCTDEMACNFNHQASSDNGSCEFISCYGCMNDIACNFNVEATHPSECTYVSLYEINGATQTIIGHDELYTYPITTGSDYIWSVIGGEIISGLETNEVIVVWSDVSGSLTVKEISSSGCEGVDVVLNLGSVSSIFDHTVQFSVYPNPANNNIVVVSDLGLSVVTIYDATGRDVYKQQHVNRTNTIDVSNLANGTYRIVADTNEGRRMQTIVISH